MNAWRRWDRGLVVVMASGPSMTQEDADRVRGRARVITVNSTFRLAPWANVHYSSDPEWWDAHADEMTRLGCTGERWTGHPTYARDGLRRCPYDKHARGISTKPGVIVWGGNSGYCAVGLAVQFGAAQIVLLGFDQQDPKGVAHWHGQHPQEIRRAFNFPMWAERFEEAARDLRRLRIDVHNCSRETSLRCFDRRKLEEVFP